MKNRIPALLLLAALGCGSQTQTSQTSSNAPSDLAAPVAVESSPTVEQATAPVNVDESADIAADDNADQTTTSAEKTPAVELEQVAGKLLELMVAGKFEEATKDFDTTVSEAMPPEKLKQTWEAVTAQVGVLKEQTAVRRSQSGPHIVIDVECAFEKSPLVFRLAFDQEHKIAGMFFLPPQTPPQENPAAATNSTKSEPGAAPQAPPLVGVWKPVKAELGGADLPDAVVGAMTLTLTAATYAVEIDGGQGSDSGTYKIDGQTNPKRLTVTSTSGVNKGKTQLAIYEISDDGVLRICYDMAGKVFPDEFKTAQGTQRFLAEYHRQKVQGSQAVPPQ
ncbi:MAG: DUF3887 domain-containing protein [Planctomycetota bacterium]|nr:DUF3887 domain-containing protein [Planctomycetota bacterium]